MTMTFPICGLIGGPPTGATNYAPIAATRLATWSTTEANRDCPVAGAMTLKDLYVRLTSAPGSGKSYTLKVRKNGADTALTVTISDLATTGNLTGQSISFAAGDTIDMASTPSGTPTQPTTVSWAINAETSDDTQVCFGLVTGNSSQSATEYAHPTAAVTGNYDATENNVLAVVPLAGTVSKLYVLNNGAPGSGKSRDTFLRINGANSAVTVNIANLATSGQDTTHSAAVAAGDTLSIAMVPNSTPANSSMSWSFLITPTTPGDCALLFGNDDPPSTSGPEYAQPQGGASGTWNPTEVNEQMLLGGGTVKALYVKLITAPGAGGSGKSYTFKLRANAADSGLAVTVSETATSGNAATDVAVTPGDAFALGSTASSSPASLTNGVHAGLKLTYVAPAATTIPVFMNHLRQQGIA